MQKYRMMLRSTGNLSFLWLTDKTICLITILVLIFMGRFQLCKSALQWRIDQANHEAINYTNSELNNRFCRSTDVNRINGYLDHIAIPRPIGSENHMKVSLFIRFTLEELGYRTEFYTFVASTIDGVKNFTNIVATKHPTAHRRLVLACHYDSKFFSSFEFVGATDSALPCALLLDVASTLNTYMPDKSENDASLQLIFFDGEEAFKYWDEFDSLYGSRHLANLWSLQSYPPAGGHERQTTELNRIDVLILLDLLGAPFCRINNYAMVNTGSVYKLFPEIENQLAKIPGCLANIDRIFDDSDSFFRVQDDHVPFFNRNVKVVHLIPWPFPNVWHTESDNREALDTPTIENLSVILRVFVARYLHL